MTMQDESLLGRGLVEHGLFVSFALSGFGSLGMCTSFLDVCHS